MQFTVLIEFLIPGLATLFLGAALFADGSWPTLPQTSSAYETINALLFIAIAYPVGILVNFLFYQPQRYAITPVIRRRIIARHQGRGIFEAPVGELRSPSKLSRQRLEDIFGALEASIFQKNIKRFDSQHQFYESLQRLARGMVLPLGLLGFWLASVLPPRSVLAFLVPGLLTGLSIWLLCHSVRAGAELMVRFLIVTGACEQGLKSEAEAANQATAPDG